MATTANPPPIPPDFDTRSPTPPPGWTTQQWSEYQKVLGAVGGVSTAVVSPLADFFGPAFKAFGTFIVNASLVAGGLALIMGSLWLMSRSDAAQGVATTVGKAVKLGAALVPK